MAQDSSSSPAGSSTLQVIVYWAVVAVPLCWGIYKTVQKSVPLFSPVAASAPASSVPAAASATPPPLASAAPGPVTMDPTLAAPVPEAAPFSTAQPSATTAPINPPASPAN